jgi:hypothetical protein
MNSTLVGIALALSGGLAFAQSGRLNAEGCQGPRPAADGACHRVKSTAPVTVAVAAAGPRRQANPHASRAGRARPRTLIYKAAFYGGLLDCRYGPAASQAAGAPAGLGQRVPSDRCGSASRTDLLNHHRPLSDQLATRPGAAASPKEPFIALAKATEEPAGAGESPISYVRRYDEKGRKVHEVWIHADFELK